MKKLIATMICIMLIITLLSIVAWGREYFIYDYEKEKILFMGSNDSSFAETINMEKNPHMIMQSYDPQKFLYVFSPDQENKKVARLAVFNTQTGRTEDLIDLGYYTICWEYSKDRKDFFIAYKTSLDNDAYDILHYNIPDMKAEVLKNVANNAMNLYLSADEKKLYLIKGKDGKNPAQMITLSYAPLKIESSLQIREDPQTLYVLSQDRAVLINKPKDASPTIQYIDTAANTVKEYKITLSKYYYQWFEKEKVLIVGASELSYRDMFIGNGEFYKISGADVTDIKTPLWFDFEYIPAQDTLAVLGEYKIQLINYADSTNKSYSTGINYYEDTLEHMLYLYHLTKIPDTNLLTISIAKQKRVRFFSLDQKKVLKEVSAGKFKLFASGDSKPSTATNPEKDKYYILSRSTDDLSAFGKDFKLIGYTSIPEAALNMYQIAKPKTQTIITTEKGIYKLEYESCTLTPIFTFKEKAKETYYIQDDNNDTRFFIVSDRELVVLNSDTLEVTSSFQFYGDPSEKYSKLKKGEQRYYFIKTLD